jgi:hypothetical protein
MGKKKAASIMKANMKDSRWPAHNHYPTDRTLVARNINKNMIQRLKWDTRRHDTEYPTILR